MKGVNDILKKLEISLIEEGQMRGHKGIDRCKIDDSFGSTIAKLEKNMRNALSNV